MSSTQRNISAKKAWGQLQERARLGEKFGFIACLALLYKSGMLDREQVRAQLVEGGVCREDLRKFREQRGEPS